MMSDFIRCFDYIFNAAFGVLSCKLQAASRKPQAASCKPQAASCKPQAASRKLQADAKKLISGRSGERPYITCMDLL
ncbi:MAG: hypothetical protein H8E46_09355 [FCB group bacterium]|nr:hypothetical protein [FCB group bacterium]